MLTWTLNIVDLNISISNIFLNYDSRFENWPLISAIKVCLSLKSSYPKFVKISIVFYLKIVNELEMYSYFKLNIFDNNIDFPVFIV